MKLPDYALSHRVVVIVSVLVLCLWGALSFQASPRRETPEFTMRVAVITTVWDGATVETIEQLVAEPLEQAVFSIDEVDRVETTVTTGLSVIRVVIDDRVPAHKVESMWDEVRAEVATVRLPSNEGCGPAVVNSNFGDTAIWMLSVYQDQSQPEENHYSSRQIEVFADQLRDQIKLLPNVATAELHGVQNEVIYLETDPRSWSKLALTTDELAMRISQRNIVTSGGTIELPVGRVNIKPSGNYSAVDQINRLVIARDAAGSPVYLEDLGIRARRGYEEPTRELDRYTNAAPDAETEAAETVLIAITMKAGRNVVALGEQLRTTLDRAHQSMLPSDIKTALIVDTPRKVGQTIRDFVVNLMQSVVIVFLVAFLLIGLRIALIMAAAIPVVMLGSFALMRLIGVELEQMSIAALIIALGMLVDNVIEVCDNTHRLLQDGRPRREAALQGAAQIGFPILIATLTTVAAFVPMIFALEGGGAEYVFSIPAVVTIALSVSWILAMTLTTVLSYWFLRHTTSQTPLVWLASQLGRLVPKRLRPGRNSTSNDPASNDPASNDPATAEPPISLYQRLAAKAIDFKLLTVGIAVAGFAFALFLLATGRIGSQFFPASVQSKLLIEVYLPDGATIAQTSDKCREVERMILGLQRPDEPARLRDIVTMVGNGGPRIELGASPADPASNYGALLVHTTGPEFVDPLIHEIRQHVLTGISGARIRPIKYGMGPPVDNPIGVRIVGPGFADLRKMRDIADHVQNVFRASQRTWDVTQNWGNLGMQLQVAVDESKATTSGVSSANVSNSLAAYYSGKYLTTFREGDHQVPLYFRWHPNERRDLDAVAMSPIEGASGKVPLEAIASTELEFVPAKIKRRNINRVIEVSARPQDGFLANQVLLEDIWPELEQYRSSLPEGYDIEIAGELAESASSQQQMGLSFQITLVLLVLLLVIQYNSVSKTLMILITIPLATTGAFLGMWIFGRPMGFMEMLGLLALVGIVLNAAIVYIEFAEMRIRERVAAGTGLSGPNERSYSGLSRAAFRTALAEAGKMRLLPIALTTFTTAGGLLPLAMSGGPLFEGMATAIIAGLLVGSAMTLLVLPALVSLFVEWFGIRFVHEVEIAP